MARLVVCPGCALLIHADEQQCPHCGAAHRSVAAPRASLILLGLTLAACPADDDGDDTAGSATTTTASSSGTAPTTGTTGNNSITDDSITGSGGVEYGSADTFTTDTVTDPTLDPTSTGTDAGTDGTGTTGTDSSTGGSDTVGEPEYGVPETTG
jgi:hypothetical protein